MTSKGLKTNMAVTLMVIVGTGMFLIDVVMMVSFQHILIRSEIQKGYLFLSSIGIGLNAGSEPEAVMLISPGLRQSIANTLNKSGFSCLLILDKHAQSLYNDETPCSVHEELEALARQTMISGQKTSEFLGVTWGVFWKQYQNVLIAAPLFVQNDIIGAAGIRLPLDGIYGLIRPVHGILIVYIMLNTLILSFVGYYQLSKLTIKPLSRLLKRAEEFRHESGFVFLEDEGNEFQQLSKALNRMLKRISDDTQSLQATIASLEQANAALHKAQKEMIRAEKMASVGRLSAGIAHEIGNPIGIVSGYLDLLKQDDISTEEKSDFIHRSQDEIARISNIIRELLDFSRPAADDPKPVSIGRILQDMAAMLRHQKLMSGIELIIDIQAQADTVFAGENQMRQVFLNLILNAVDAIGVSPNKGKGVIAVRTEVESPENAPPMLKILITDNGCGISKTHLDAVFDPFFTTKEPGKGTGLGLSVSLSIVETAGGTLQVASEEGKGTTMTMRLPLHSSLNNGGMSSEAIVRSEGNGVAKSQLRNGKP